MSEERTTVRIYYMFLDIQQTRSLSPRVCVDVYKRQDEVVASEEGRSELILFLLL